MATEPTRPEEPIESVGDATGTRAVVHDRRGIVRGALPRHTQAWIMVGLACLILAVIVLIIFVSVRAAPRSLDSGASAGSE